MVAVMGDASGSTPTITVTSTGITFTKRVTSGELTGSNGTAQIFTGVTPDATARTVAASTANLANQHGAIKVWVVDGADNSVVVDASNTGASTTNNINGTVTVVTAGSWVFGCASEWQDLGVPTSTDVAEGFSTTDLAGIVARKSATSSAGSVSVNFDAFGTAAATWNWSLLSVVPTVTAASLLPQSLIVQQQAVSTASLW